MAVNPYVEAARPRTLPAAVTPVVVGTAAAQAAPHAVSWVRFGLALVVALALQVAVNYANDWFDAVKGVDTPERVGPRRAVASGLVTVAAMRTATFATIGVAAAAGLALAWLAGWELAVVGVVAILAALGYSGGGRPYASRGLGEVSVFIFFGLVATIGSQYVQDERLHPVAAAAAVQVGLVAVALLVVNNLRDIPTDAHAGKRTLAVRIGEAGTRRLFVGLVGVAIVWTGVIAVVAGSAWPLTALVAAPVGILAALDVRRAALGPDLIRALEKTGRFHLLQGVALAAGLLAGSR